MDQDAKIQKFNCREQRNSEKNMAKNVSTRSSSFGAVASSSKNSESVSTSPILDTVKIRRKGKLLTTRRTVSDSAFSPGLAKLTKGQEIQTVCSRTKKTKKLDNFFSNEELKQCKSCDSLLNADNQCKNCSSNESINKKSKSLDKNLESRLIDLKSLKKSTTRISDSKDVQITDKEFVQSVRILDNDCDLELSKKKPKSPANNLRLEPFIDLERLRLSQLQHQKNSSSGPTKLTKDEEIQAFCSTTEKTKELDNFSCNKELEQCKCCDSLLNADNKCENCSSNETTNQNIDSVDENLVNRLRNLKCLKKPTPTISDFKDAQITDEEFVQNVRMLDKACDSNSPKKKPQSPAKSLGLVPFIDLERLRLSQLQFSNSHSSSSSGSAKLTKDEEIQAFCSTTEKTKQLDNFSCNKELEQCKCCDSLLNNDNKCKNCSSNETINQNIDSVDKNLVNRLRNLKCLKKPTPTISDFKDAQITDEEFVQSVRMLDKACDLNSPKKKPQSPAKSLGLVPFIDLERFRLSQLKEQKNSLPVIHLSLDEDKEEDGDMFADKDSAETVEDLNEFTPWKYNSCKTSPLSFRGFSTEEFKSSRELAEKLSQVSNFEQIDTFFFGFTSADIEESENRFQKFKRENLKRNRENLNDILDDKEDFSLKSKITQISADVEKNPIHEIVDTENVFFNLKLKRKRKSEYSSKIEDRCKKRITNIAELGNEEFLANYKKEEEFREIITKSEDISSPRIKCFKENPENDSKADFFNSQNKFGFSTAAGRPIKLSETAIAKAKLFLSQEIESIDDDLMDNFELDNVRDSQIKCEILNANKLSICGSKTNEGKYQEKYETETVKTFKSEIEAKSEIKSEAKAEAFSEIECIEDDLFEELDNVIDSENKFGLLKVEENPKRQKHELLDHKSDAATISRISCGFSTAGGIPIRVSKTALENAETRLAKKLKSFDDEFFSEIGSEIESGSESGLLKTDDRLLETKTKKTDRTLDHELDVTDSQSSSKFSTAGRIPIRVSKSLNLENTETLLSEEIEDVKNEVFDELDNATNLGIKCATEREISKSKTSLKKILKNSPIKIMKSLENENKINFGFATAGGRELKVSEKSWKKSKAVFDTIEESCESEIGKTTTNSEFSMQNDSKINFGFAAAGERELKVSEKSWTKSKAVFDTIEESCEAETVKITTNSEFSMKNDSKINFGFKTAGERELKVSEKSWKKSKAVFDTIEEPSEAETVKTTTNSEFSMKNDSKINFGFKTAGGRELKVSEKSWKKSKAVFDTIEESCESKIGKTTTNSEFSMQNDSKINFGFKTAGERELKVSEKSWKKSKAVFDTIEEPSEAETVKTTTNSEFSMKNDSKINFGFKTAGGRELKVSEKSWKKSKAVFDTIEESCESKIGKITTNSEFSMQNDSKINFGFKTAGGCELKVSEKSWKKSKAVFDTIEESCESEIGKTTTNSEFSMQNDSKINFGFAAAGERELKVSEKSWEKSKAVFDTIEESCESEIGKTTTNSEFSMQNDSKINFGFKTAGGRELKVSEKSWKNSKAVFDTIDESCVLEQAKTNSPGPKNLPSNIKPKTIISGFSTAKGQSIIVTKEAVSTAQIQLSSDLDNIEFLEFDDFVDPEEESEVSKKRKLKEIDEDTPLRSESFLKRKRGRYVNDLQARKLFMEDPNKEDDVEMTKKSSEKNLISEEVDASAAALLEDEERSNEAKTWQINALRSPGSISPELGCEMANRSRVDVSANNSFGILNRDELEKVNATEETEKSSSSRAASSGSCAETKENNQRAMSAEKREEIQHESIPDDLTFDSQFSQDIQRSPVIDKFIADAMKIMEGRLAFALKQDEAIRGKRNMKIVQSDGFLYRLRNDNKESRISWDELTDGIAPSQREIARDFSRKDVVAVTANSAIDYSFRCADFYGETDVRRNIEGIEVGDGAFLVLDEKNCAGAREFERAFLASPGVDPNLVSTGWVKNHYRWIVWKLASMDKVKFGHKCLPRMLTPDRVMLELKYRYDREIYRTQWPPLKRILERGEDASARLILCVSSIVKENNVNAPIKGAHTPNSMGSTIYKMKVTDGWYSISTSIDAAMMNFIKSGKVREGTKLMIFGAKAVNLDQGCSVLEIPEAVSLRIYSNSTRRTKWNTKLDFYRTNRGPMSLSLKSVKSNGGAICKLVVAVSRVYPILYREKLPDGQFVFRNARCDEEAARAHEARYQAKMEEIYANAWSEFQIGSMKKKGIAATKSRSYTQEEAAACGRDMEEELRQKISSKMSECLPTPRDVTPVIKIRIAQDDTCALMTVWSTDRDTTELFVEGSSIAIYNAFASGLRSSELQITAGRSTFVKRENLRQISYPERIYTSLSDVTKSGFNPVYGEFDTIGIVSSTGPAPHGMKNFETVNLACPKSEDADASDFLSVLFWQGVSAHGYAKILTVGSLVACSNLEWRRNTSRSIPTAYCTERSIFSKNPRQNHLVKAFESLRNEIKQPQVYAAACAVVIQEEIAKKSALRTPGNYGTPYKPATSNNRTPGLSPRDLPIDATCNTPTIDSKKMSTRKRLEKLEVYGEPPKLPSIVINNSSRNVSSDFRSPVLTPVNKS